MRTALLDRATSWCAPTNASNLPSCALEALRISIDGQASSSNSCSDADLAYYKWAIDGEDDPVTGGTQFNLERTEGPISGTAYDMDMGNCQCDDAMIPTCACAAIPPPPSPSHIEVDANLAIIIPAIVASIVVCSFFGYASRWCRRQDKPFNSNVDAQGHFRPQQQQQGGVQMAQYGHPQPPPPREGTCTRRRGTRSNRSTVRCLHTVNHLRDITVRCPRTVNRLRGSTDRCLRTVNRRGRIRQRRRGIIRRLAELERPTG